jgi:hypothetical protein
MIYKQIRKSLLEFKDSPGPPWRTACGAAVKLVRTWRYEADGSYGASDGNERDEPDWEDEVPLNGDIEARAVEKNPPLVRDAFI